MNLQTDRTFTGQKADETGLMFFEARYYDSALGTFLSPDSLVPEPGRVVDYNRFAFVPGNPLKYVDPTGHYSDEALYEHIGCQEQAWSCVLAHFEKGGSHEGLWGWLELLMRAEDGAEVELFALSNNNRYAKVTGRFATVNGRIVVQNGQASFFDGNTAEGGWSWAEALPEEAFASMAYINVGGSQSASGFYLSSAYGSFGFGQQQMDCRHNDCGGRALNAVSTGASIVAAGCTYFAIAPCTAAAGSISFGAGAFATIRTTRKALNGDATALDVVVSTFTTAKGRLNPYAGPVYAGIQWIFDEVISPNLAR